MATTHFSGAVNSANGFEGPSIAAADGTAAIAIANSTGVVTFAAAVAVTGSVTGQVFDSVQALSGAGAVSVTTGLTAFTSTGSAQALTLANGTAGQLKRIVHTVDGGSGVLTPTTKIGFSTVTFTNVGDAVQLSYTSTGWAVTGISGATLA